MISASAAIDAASALPRRRDAPLMRWDAFRSGSSSRWVALGCARLRVIEQPAGGPTESLLLGRFRELPTDPTFPRRCEIAWAMTR
jgi:hypothetical protein